MLLTLPSAAPYLIPFLEIPRSIQTEKLNRRCYDLSGGTASGPLDTMSVWELVAQTESANVPPPEESHRSELMPNVFPNTDETLRSAVEGKSTTRATSMPGLDREMGRAWGAINDKQLSIGRKRFVKRESARAG